MSARTKFALAICVTAFVAGCNRQPAPEPYVAPLAPAPITAEPAFTGKYN